MPLKNLKNLGMPNTIADYYQNAEELFAKVKKDFGTLVDLAKEVTAPFANDNDKMGLFYQALLGNESTNDEQINEAIKKLKG